MVCNCEPFEVGGFLCLLFQLLVGCIVKPVQYVVVVEGSYTSGALAEPPTRPEKFQYNFLLISVILKRFQYFVEIILQMHINYTTYNKKKH